MKEKINNYNRDYTVQTEVINPSIGSYLIVKATIKVDENNTMKPTRIFTAHASGAIGASKSINSIEEEAINRAMSLV